VSASNNTSLSSLHNGIKKVIENSSPATHLEASFPVPVLVSHRPCFHIGQSCSCWRKRIRLLVVCVSMRYFANLFFVSWISTKNQWCFALASRNSLRYKEFPLQDAMGCLASHTGVPP
jgi:hypothetical protein